MNSISAIGSATSATTAYAPKTASDGDSAAVEANESASTKLSEKLNGGAQPKTSSSSAQQSNLTKLRTYANQNMPVSQIATLLGQPISTVMQEASAAGINLNSGGPSSQASTNPAVGQNVNTTA